MSILQQLFDRIQSVTPSALKKNAGKTTQHDNTADKTTQRQVTTTMADANYFTLARHWADDVYTSAVVSRNRYQLAFFAMCVLSALLTIAIIMLVPTQHLEPLLVNHYSDGRVSVTPLKQNNAPINNAQVQSDIVRYVINRESYSAQSYDAQFSLVELLSTPSVTAQYLTAQKADNKHSPIHTLGKTGVRSVHVDNVLFLDRAALNQSKNATDNAPAAHHNLAQVNFTMTNHLDGNTNTIPLTAVISWTYHGTPTDPQQRWRNWDGFSVTAYRVQQRNVTTST